MARRKDSPQKAAMREMMRDYLKNNDISIKDGTDVNSIMRDMMSVLLEGALDEELDEELGYSKYDYNKYGNKKWRVALLRANRKCICERISDVEKWRGIWIICQIKKKCCCWTELSYIYGKLYASS